jgi:hypothetical protein
MTIFVLQVLAAGAGLAAAVLLISRAAAAAAWTT